MGLRVDRQAALGWLGIEGYRPSGRVPLPVGKSARAAPDVLAQPGTDASLADDGLAVAMPEQFDTSSRPASSDTPAPAGPADMPAEPASPVAQPQPVEASPSDRLSVMTGSPYRALAEAIARAAGLACETGEDGDVLMLGGEAWALSTLAGDAQAKRRLWRALTERARRPRG